MTNSVVGNPVVARRLGAASLSLLLMFAWLPHVAGQTVVYAFTNFVGRANYGGSADGTGTNASFAAPTGVAVDNAGTVYVADSGNDTIRKVTRTGVVTTWAGSAMQWGSADGSGNTARFFDPVGLALDKEGNVYVADTRNYTIRKITPAGEVSTLAGLAGQRGSVDGLSSAARFGGPTGIAVDAAGNIYVADYRNDTIRKITTSGWVTTLAGMPGVAGSADGTGAAARFAGPVGVAVDEAGQLFVTDQSNDTIREVSPDGVVTTLAGAPGQAGHIDGTDSAARFYQPWGVAADAAGNLYVADSLNTTVRKVTPAGVVTTVAGAAGRPSGFQDGVGGAAQFDYPSGVALDTTGGLYVTDNMRITKGIPVPAFTGHAVGVGQVTWTLDGLLGGATVVVESSTNLLAWFPVSTNTAGPFPSTLLVTRPLGLGVAMEFLRASWR